MRILPSLEGLAAELLDGRSEVRVLAAMAPEQPDELLAAVLREARRRAVTVHLLIADTTGAFAFLDADGERGLEDGSLTITMLAGSVPRRIAPRVDSVPVSLWEVDRLLASGAIRADVFVLQAHAATGDRRLDLGRTVGYTPTVLARDDVRVGIQLSDDDRALGLAPVERDALDSALAVRVPAARRPTGPAPVADPDPVKDAIVRRLADLIPPDATLQVGIGGVAETLVDAVADRPLIGIHSGILPNTLRAHLAAGRFAGRAKTIDPGLAVATGLAPDAGDARWSHAARLRPISATHDPAVLAEQHRLWAINSAFSIDLAGQVNAERLGAVKVACGAGQLDFARAAHLSPGGASVLALPSRSSRGRPRVEPRLEAGVTTPANDVDIVVTEYGAARLTGLSLRERAAAIIAVAHPDDRRSLAADD